MNRVAIIGCGHGGVQVADSLRKEGYDGEIILIGKEDVLPYHRPPLSKAFLKSETASAQLLRPEAFFQAQRIERISATVSGIDATASRLQFEDGTLLEFSYLVIATGARPRLPKIAETGLDNVHVLRTLSDAQKLRVEAATASSVIIVGGGYIGLEVAQSLSALGKRVTVLEQAPVVLGRGVSPGCREFLHSQAVSSGIRIVTDADVAAIGRVNNRVDGVTIASGEILPADLLVIGAGVLPNAELAAVAGLEVSDGIVVDAALRTSVSNIFAIGDVAHHPNPFFRRRLRVESVQNATDQAKSVARTLTGHAQDYANVPWFWSDLGSNKLQIVGSLGDADHSVMSGTASEGAFSIYHFGGGRLTGVESVNRQTDHMLGRRLLSCAVPVLPDDVRAGPERLREIMNRAAPAAQVGAAGKVSQAYAEHGF